MTVASDVIERMARRRADKTPPAGFGEPAGGDSFPRYQQAGGRHRRCAFTQAGDPR